MNQFSESRIKWQVDLSLSIVISYIVHPMGYAIS